MEDRYKYIDWWVWETKFGKDHPNVTWNSSDGEPEKVWVLDTPEALYDYLVENAKHNDSNEPISTDSNTRTISMEEFMQIAERQILGIKE